MPKIESKRSKIDFQILKLTLRDSKLCPHLKICDTKKSTDMAQYRFPLAKKLMLRGLQSTAKSLK